MHIDVEAVGVTVHDPGCETGGFLIEAFGHVRIAMNQDTTADEFQTFGR